MAAGLCSPGLLMAPMLQSSSSKKMTTSLGIPRHSAYSGMVQLIRPSLSFLPNRSRRLVSTNYSELAHARPGLVRANMPYQPLVGCRKPVSLIATRTNPSLVICANALAATCRAAQTESREATTVPVSPFLVREPKLDSGGGSGSNNGNDLPRFYRGDDGGGGGGSGGGGGGRGGGGGGGDGGFISLWGAFWFYIFFGFLVFNLSKDKEKEARYRERNGRNKTISDFLQ